MEILGHTIDSFSFIAGMVVTSIISAFFETIWTRSQKKKMKKQYDELEARINDYLRKKEEGKRHDSQE